jgi:hypothetical protein
MKPVAKARQHLFEFFAKVFVEPSVQKRIVTSRAHCDGVGDQKEDAVSAQIEQKTIESGVSNAS